MTASPAPLAIVGAGSLGQSYAALLAHSGQPVTVLATARTAAHLLGRGQVQLQETVDIAVPVAPAPAPPGTVGVTTDAAELPASVGLIFTTKAHQLSEAIGAVRAGWPRTDDNAAWVAGVQNGIVKDDLLAAVFGAERVVGAATILGAQRTPEGPVRVTALGMTYFGEFAGGPSTRVEGAVAAFTRAGIPVEAPANIRSVLWSKMCNATGVFGVSVLVGPEGPVFTADPDLIRAYLTLVRETAAIARAEGVAVDNYPRFPPMRTYVEQSVEETIAALPPPPPPSGGSRALPSMVQDYLAGRPMEVEAIFGDVVARAERAGVSAPCLAFVRDLLRALNRANVRHG
jgi:2-dehydropantoate 2-reductase